MTSVKQLECRFLFEGCEETFEGETEESLLQQVAIHAREAHGLDEIPPEMVDQVRAAIHDRDPR